MSLSLRIFRRRKPKLNFLAIAFIIVRGFSSIFRSIVILLPLFPSSNTLLNSENPLNNSFAALVGNGAIVYVLRSQFDRRRNTWRCIHKTEQTKD